MSQLPPATIIPAVTTAQMQAVERRMVDEFQIPLDATLDRVGLKRNFDLLSQLDNEVWAVCKGF